MKKLLKVLAIIFGMLVGIVILTIALLPIVSSLDFLYPSCFEVGCLANLANAIAYSIGIASVIVIITTLKLLKKHTTNISEDDKDDDEYAKIYKYYTSVDNKKDKD